MFMLKSTHERLMREAEESQVQAIRVLEHRIVNLLSRLKHEQEDRLKDAKALDELVPHLAKCKLYRPERTDVYRCVVDFDPRMMYFGGMPSEQLEILADALSRMVKEEVFRSRFVRPEEKLATMPPALWPSRDQTGDCDKKNKRLS